MAVFTPFDFPFQQPAALLVIDMQRVGTDPGAGLCKAIEDANPGYTRYLVERVKHIVIPAIRSLQLAFRARGQPVFYALFGSVTGDGLDVNTSTIRYRNAQRRAQTGVSVIVPRSNPLTDVIPELAPLPGETVLSKTSMDAFVSTPLAQRLRERGVRTLVVTGVLSDACVESSARHAAELGFEVFVAEDGCAAWEGHLHDKSMANLARYFARVESAAAIVAALADAAQRTEQLPPSR